MIIRLTENYPQKVENKPTTIEGINYKKFKNADILELWDEIDVTENIELGANLKINN